MVKYIGTHIVSVKENNLNFLILLIFTCYSDKLSSLEKIYNNNTHTRSDMTFLPYAHNTQF